MEIKTNPIQVADKLFAAIELLAERGPMGITDISQALEINKATVHRLLNSLVFMDYVKQDATTAKYRLSFKFCTISQQILNKIDITAVVRPYLEELSDKTGETVHLVQLDDRDAFYIDKIESSANSVRLVSQLGSRLPLYATGVGKALLAEMPDDEIAAIWQASDVHPITPHTITELDALMVEIEKIRSRGYSIDDEENELGIRCVAAAIGESITESPYGISTSAPLYRLDDERILAVAQEVLKTKARIRRALSL